jgi:hypothetical protein
MKNDKILVINVRTNQKMLFSFDMILTHAPDMSVYIEVKHFC